MISKEQLMLVAVNCPEYSTMDPGLSATIGGEHGISCETCNHWKNKRCKIDVFDDVLDSVDQT